MHFVLKRSSNFFFFLLFSKDVNNWWIVKRPDREDLAVHEPIDVIKDGDVIQLVSFLNFFFSLLQSIIYESIMIFVHKIFESLFFVGTWYDTSRI